MMHCFTSLQSQKL